jgi:hypothetical protein
MPGTDHWKTGFVHFLLKDTKDGNIQNVISHSTESKNNKYLNLNYVGSLSI